MAKNRSIDRILKSQPVIEGAGVRLRRVFGFYEEGLLDPFLLLDHFGSDIPEDYLAGFPWHPHRGMDTVTYMIEGSVEHSDSMGNRGIVSSGDVQWMSSGSGIIHQEMPQKYDGNMRGFQLWVNIPAAFKMMPPRYRDIKAKDIPQVKLENGIKVKVIAGNFRDTVGPVSEVIADPVYLDIEMPENSQFSYPIEDNYTAFAYVFEGAAYFDDPVSSPVRSGELAILKNGDSIFITTGDSPARMILVSGKPLNEPVAWRGPIVMNSEDEIRTAFEEYRAGRFIK